MSFSVPISSHTITSGDKVLIACVSPSDFGYPFKTSQKPKSFWAKPAYVPENSLRSSITLTFFPLIDSFLASSRKTVVLPLAGTPAKIIPLNL